MCVFVGKVLHSHEYRYPELFSGQSVVLLGAKASGLDISIELAKVGAKVTNASYIQDLIPGTGTGTGTSIGASLA